MRTTIVPLLAALALAGCVQTPELATPAPALDGRHLLALVRAAAHGEDVLEVLPLADPAAEDLRRHAAALEDAGEYAHALARIEQALALSPQDPVLLQWRAELLLAGLQLDDAERQAWASYQQGPQLGPLCRRNWATIQIARGARGDADGAELAARQGERCRVEAPVRM